MTGTKRVAESEKAAEDDAFEKQNPATAVSANAPMPKRRRTGRRGGLLNMTDEELYAAVTQARGISEQIRNTPPVPLRTEKEIITDDLEAGTHDLILEYNESPSAKCRANKCLVEEHQYHDKIQGPYRINLSAKVPSQAHWSQQVTPNRRFFHVPCLEEIGVDIAKYVKRPPELTLTPLPFGGMSTESCFFHPAIVHWMETGGKAFDADNYHEYHTKLKEHKKACSDRITHHAMGLCKTKCSCGPVPEKPNISDFIQGEPSGSTLTNVLLHVLGAGELMPYLLMDKSMAIRTLDGVGHSQGTWLQHLRGILEKSFDKMEAKEIEEAEEKKDTNKTEEAEEKTEAKKTEEVEQEETAEG